MSAKHEVNQHDVQGNILLGYGDKFPYALYVFVQIGDQHAGRSWLRDLVPRVTSTYPWPTPQTKPPEALNVAFSHRGLERLGVPRQILEGFPEEFKQGMARRAALLGDTAASAPGQWDPALHEPHAVVTLFARSDVRVERAEELRAEVASYRGDMAVTHVQCAGLLEDGNGGYAREHFGFADGFSQPAIRGNAGPDTRRGMGTPTRRGWDEVAPGEFVLGHLGEDGLRPKAPPEPLGYGGSFMVLRKLHQDVPAFRAYLRSIAGSHQRFLPGEPPADDDPERERKLGERQRLVAAKMVGRWPDGRSLVRSREPHVPAGHGSLGPTKINRFRYARAYRFRGLWPRAVDQHGFACPLGAHVRRANPRDSLGWNGLLTKRHRLIRRSMPYGTPAFDGRDVPDHERGGIFHRDADDDDRGLIFVCFQTSIERQFELIQTRWLNDGDAFWLGGERDCLSTGAGMTVQGRDGPAHLPAPGVPFVTTKGGDYFFAPGLPALRALASAYWD